MNIHPKAEDQPTLDDCRAPALAPERRNALKRAYEALEDEARRYYEKQEAATHEAQESEIENKPHHAYLRRRRAQAALNQALILQEIARELSTHFPEADLP